MANIDYASLRDYLIARMNDYDRTISKKPEAASFLYSAYQLAVDCLYRIGCPFRWDSNLCRYVPDVPNLKRGRNTKC